MWGIIFICTVTVLQVAASLAYAWDGDWRRTAFWLCAATMNMVITF